MLSLWLNVLASGILLGLVYGLVALGLTIIFGVMRVVNFAHGEMVVFGVYVGYWTVRLWDIPIIAAAAISAVAMFIFGYLLEILIVKRFVNRPQHDQFIVFIGLSLLFSGALLVAFGPDPRPTASQLSFQTISLGVVALDLARLQAAATAALLIALLGAYLKFSSFGRSLRAAADNRLGGLIVGLNIPRIYAVTFGIGAACAGVAGALISPLFDAQPYLAVDFTLLAFVTVIVGGLGSFGGALLGGLVIGVAEAIAALMFTPSMKTALPYALLIIILIFRPRGFFGAREI
ncbi:branched-chain amino acid ABC transporter permease [Bradyrhizobium sp. U87765 SZCCT0131]|uniref:branched-chain amino acid ABC transporter permease n=1 Tax=unclassified Bradyrhizobium TaxID=2631580 RepID=UPI001BAACBA3|nr:MULTISPECIES: branched-chain amino acid ABC transporter permease [unclassified Bradyrhizobium]MBR1217879.1 branched-chain amino acid ABC transporter permease [Bradyrhizobium sp. U87765 SZCCT0131]MBR1261175.1 branched-chain amino acid ABC transporter permease [Bradyrhizobium sp. U87765 SZCCT0134]MBR1303377.1 branched-chain amino acid ABC transporter permease [Bradyrhizobium sp. U87765 SZCCT0110]MBR1318983.1 branched-chain amino acid ABC transporter permease [Bradyrhizobium sp. U87765 SZCCT010